MAAVTRSASASPSVSPLNAAATPVDASLFPLKSIADVVGFFRRALEQSEPDLTLLSIVAGFIELSLTTGDAAQAAAAAASAAEASSTSASLPIGGSGGVGGGSANATAIAGIVGSGLAAALNTDIIMGNSIPFPVITHELVSGLYKKFQSILSVVERPKSSSGVRSQATREIIKKVSDVIWHSLIRSTYKDRAHLQNLYSYLSGNKLDCFGVALAVVAGCQLLGYRDVRLAIAEDHAWVVFGNKQRSETIEVTWHGKGSEDKRGQDITPGIESGSWLYLSGLAVICDRAMEVAAIVSAINISLTANSDCVEVAELQQKLLWLLYDLGHLKKYPMALGSLGELEEINPTHKSISCEQLYREAIQAAREHYRNHHVYPYTYQGNYYNRLLKYRDAFAAWANAADVIRLYTYNCRDDEEIYKELLDIANEMIPYVMKTESSGHSARSILRNSEVFANLLRFYDGICQWEEDSLTPILHIGWAKPLVNNITKFDYDIRSQVIIKVPEDEEMSAATGAATASATTTGRETEAAAGVAVATAEAKQESSIEAKKEHNLSAQLVEVHNNNNSILLKKDEKSSNETKKAEIPTTLADLTAACGEKILNPDFLLQGGGQPFAEQKQQQNNHNNNNNNTNNNEANGTIKTTTTTKTTKTSSELQQKQKPYETKTLAAEAAAATAAPLKATKEAETRVTVANTTTRTTTSTTSPTHNTPSPPLAAAGNAATISTAATAEEDDPFAFMLKRPIITLYSQKMKGLKDLLLAEKLNTHAISLQVTAQSVKSKKVRGIDKLGNHTTNSTYASANVGSSHHHHQSLDSTDSIAASRPKRTRRE